ncbi:hypothetical protein NCC78_16740 [Micromonospora phytophila]|uniref:hypothetical protein n=1 Tax=Micromonospora phytophila TaxID=709888 RepID=UPI00202EDA62|nr:hypothetical protein [Micromonospora phytophila]MCM0676322.1 hypothetical protein [Micromonospora phytophila]
MGETVLRCEPRLVGLAANRALPPELLDLFARRADGALCAFLADRDDLTPAHRRSLVAGGGTDVAVRLARRGLLDARDADPDDVSVLLALLDEGVDRPEWARRLARHPDPEVRARLAGVAGLPPDVVVLLAGDSDVDVVAEVAHFAPLAPMLAADLARHPHTVVRRALAANERTPPVLLAALAMEGGRPAAAHCCACQGPPGRHRDVWCEDGGHQDAVSDIQGAAAANPATPADAVAGLSAHPSMVVRWTLAARDDLPAYVYRELAVDPVPVVRGDLAQNPAIGEDLIRAMATDRAYDVQRRLAHHPHVPLDVLTHLATVARIGPTLLPRIALATPEEIDLLGGSPVPAVRMLLARRTDLPPPLLAALAADPDAKVVAAVADNPALTGAQLRAMVDAHGTRVSSRVARNPSCPPELLEHLVAHAGEVRRIHREVARHPRATGATLVRCLTDERARAVAARHPALDPGTLLVLLDAPDPDVAEAAAANPSLPRPTMERLLAKTR